MSDGSLFSECLNLEKLFGDRFRIYWDQARQPGCKRDPWLMEIRGCGRGIRCYPAGGNRLRVDVDCRPKIAARLVRLSGFSLVQDGDTEKTIEFPVSLIESAHSVLRFRRRRQLSDKERTRLAQIRPLRCS